MKTISEVSTSASADAAGDAVAGEHLAEHDPGLAAHLGEDPAEGVGRERQQRQDQRGARPASVARGCGRCAVSPQHAIRAMRGGGHAEADHQAEAPVGDRDDRGVAAGPYWRAYWLLQVVDAADLAVRVAGARGTTAGTGS